MKAIIPYGTHAKRARVVLDASKDFKPTKT
jgi:hypothetical protein